MNQRTLVNTYSFEGKGLHTGKYAHLNIKPAPANTGIVFVRTDAEGQPQIEALAENVSQTSRCTTISKGGVSVWTIEHLMSALTGLGVDNAYIELDNEEVPILDGSARFYVEAILKDGLEVQDAERNYITLSEPVEIKDETTGSYIRISPAEETDYELTVDFNSRILGVQTVHWDYDMDYAEQIAPCRTFVFFHEIEFLAANGLVKGGYVDNAIIIVEHPVKDEQISRLANLFDIPKLEVTGEGYLNNLTLHFPDECGRHKLLDLIGDLRLCGGFLRAKIDAYKPGHSINTAAAKIVRKK